MEFTCNQFTSLIGYVTIAYITFQCLRFLWTMFRLYGLTSIGFVKDLTKYGEWAIVTGATDGIGKEYARQFAKQGFKIVLISRTEEKLERVRKEIEEEFHAETKIICFDFNKTVGYDKIEEIITDLDVGILVNNVGMVRYYNGYSTSDINQVYDILHCNVFSNLHMTHIVLKGMTRRKRGAILHISSLSAYQDIRNTMYPATKGFMKKFCKSLQLEGTGIDHQLVTPGFVSSNMSLKRPDYDVPTAADYVKSAIRTIGIADVTCGYFVHELHRLLINIMPSIADDALLNCVKKHGNKSE